MKIITNESYRKIISALEVATAAINMLNGQIKIKDESLMLKQKTIDACELSLSKITRDYKTLSSVVEQMTNHAEHLRKKLDARESIIVPDDKWVDDYIRGIIGTQDTMYLMGLQTGFEIMRNEIRSRIKS